MDYSDSEDDSYNDVNFWRVSPMVFLPQDDAQQAKACKEEVGGNDNTHTDNDDNSLNNSTGDVVLVEQHVQPLQDQSCLIIIPKDAYQLVVVRDFSSGKAADASSVLLANALNRLTDNCLYLAGDGPRLSKVAERAAELRKELMAAQKELEGVSGPYDDYFVQQWKRSVVNQVKAEVDMADIELEKQGQDKDLLEQYTGTSQGDSQLVVARKFEVKATRSSDTATTATTCGSLLNLLATGAYDGGDGRDASLPKHAVAFRIVSDRITEGHVKVNVPVSGREVPLRKYKFEVSISGKVIRNACVAWDGCEWSPADGVTDEDYCNVNGDGDESAVELKFDQGIAMLEYACVLQTLNKIASVYHVLDEARDTSPQLNTAVALLESLSLGKCQCFPVYYNGTYLARLHIAARHVIHDGPWARRLSDEIRARCACFLACDLRQLIPDDTRCPCTIDGMVDQVKRSTRGIPSDDLTSAERRLLDLVERSF
ncbi:hypothetical protein FOZ62_021085 [Perkinsus olseni]|uniref:Uncharacterized protein n=1 Tax=Perkinsus olseni TaxID=32597 RepID=A0A7J6PVG3_PEROL|nr:hypothetical protein FOZ62_021085 [Perkinsus olseni]